LRHAVGNARLSPSGRRLWQAGRSLARRDAIMPRCFFLMLAVALATVAAPAAEPALSGEPVVGEAALRATLVGRTFYGRYDGGGPWIEYYAPDGRSAYWDGCTHDGRWWIADDHVCFRYRGDVEDAEYCWRLYRTDSGIEFIGPDDGAAAPARAYTTAIRQGNSENLPLGADDCVSAAGRRLDGPLPR
jgi:hypothetical protein